MQSLLNLTNKWRWKKSHRGNDNNNCNKYDADVDFQADTNPVQVLCTPTRRGQQCLTNNVAHIREEYWDIQSRGMTGNTSDRDGGRSKQYFPMAVDVALLLLLHIHIVNTCLFSALLLSPLSTYRDSSSSSEGFSATVAISSGYISYSIQMQSKHPGFMVKQHLVFWLSLQSKQKDDKIIDCF